MIYHLMRLPSIVIGLHTLDMVILQISRWKKKRKEKTS